ncbi:hypothetical protein DICVIV_03241 [Dictyocaulus viviparus]|uniref:Ribosomal RNA-processing protein 7 C-terminal domain-containing protein n=1 Tax=Dictyocaulus viviparus TaxID=29172 RepID=A0A0D8Y313_DICVI|nr:hypothetical protein DICVIV_03241 [Dictyocaulus viviparus]
MQASLTTKQQHSSETVMGEEIQTESFMKGKRKRLKKKLEPIVKSEHPEPEPESLVNNGDLAKYQTTADNDELRYLRYSINERYSSPRHLFLKSDKSNEFSLIVANVPAYLPTNFVEGFLSQFVSVPIQEVVVKRTSALNGSKSYGQLTLSVVFNDPSGVSLALENCQNVGPYRVCDFCKVDMPSVLRNSIKSYRAQFQSVKEIEECVENFMRKQDEEVKETKRLAKRKFTEPDEEGWITVTKAAKKVGKVIKLKKDDIPLMGGLRRKKNYVDLAFYSFDKKNARAKKLAELREKFMQDKKRIALLKNARKFNPD